MYAAFGCLESTTTTGTGNLTIAQVTGYPRISEVGFTHTNARRFPYSIVDQDYKPIERGWGFLTTNANTLVRDQIFTTYISATYDDLAPTPANLGSGTKYVLLTPGPAVAVIQFPLFGFTAKTATNGFMEGAEVAASKAGANTLHFIPWYLRQEIECTGMQMHNIGTHPSDTERFGLYTIGKDGRPAKVLMDTGAISVSSSSVKTYSLGTNIRLYPGVYYLAWNGTGGSATWTGYTMAGIGGMPFGSRSDSNNRVVIYAYIGSVTDAALVNDPAGTLIALNTPQNVPNVSLLAL